MNNSFIYQNHNAAMLWCPGARIRLKNAMLTHMNFVTDVRIPALQDISLYRISVGD